MPVATPDAYADLLDRAKNGGFAYPAINVTSSETLNAALRGFAAAGSDLKAAEEGMAERVGRAGEALQSAGTSA